MKFINPRSYYETQPLIVRKPIVKMGRLKSLVLASGIWNFLLGLVTILTGLSAYGSNNLELAYHNILLALFLFFTSAALVLCSRNLAGRATIVFWEGYLRIAAAILFLTLGTKIIGNSAIFVAATDLAWAAVYQIGLCRSLKRSYWQLLTDHDASRDESE